MNRPIAIRPLGQRQAKELVVISGKGGTGKTSLVASFAALAHNAVVADCDVDAADLHLLLGPHIVHRELFVGGKRARIRSEQCMACGNCEALCKFNAIRSNGPGNESVENTFRVDPIACEGCGVCAWFCPEDAIEFLPAVNGEWSISEMRFGPMVHAKLGIAEENSGKLVSVVRTNAKQTAEERSADLVIIDGPPGIGCPVIASITGTDLVLIVTEPTQSGLHDLERVADLARHFGTQVMVCINKWDINPEMSGKIEAAVLKRGLTLAGKVRYDRAVTEAQIQQKSLVEHQTDGCSADIRGLWMVVKDQLDGSSSPLA
jgi:MinD superfamily P-loop ATPase